MIEPEPESEKEEKKTEEDKVPLEELEKIKLHFEVEDTGIGIKEENIEKLFKMFEQLGIE